MQIEKSGPKFETIKSKYKLLIIATVLIISCILMIFAINNMINTNTIEKLTNVNFNKISYVKTGGALEQNQKMTINDFTSLFKDIKFKKSDVPNIGSTANIYYVCYDKNDNALYTVVDIGNRNLYFIGEGNNREEFKLYEALGN
jgi:hypothetical protein